MYTELLPWHFKANIRHCQGNDSHQIPEEEASGDVAATGLPAGALPVDAPVDATAPLGDDPVTRQPHSLTLGMPRTLKKSKQERLTPQTTTMGTVLSLRHQVGILRERLESVMCLR